MIHYIKLLDSQNKGEFLRYSRINNKFNEEAYNSNTRKRVKSYCAFDYTLPYGDKFEMYEEISEREALSNVA
jgi:hypothetical protein